MTDDSYLIGSYILLADRSTRQPKGPTTVDRPGHNVTRRRYPFAHGLLAIALTLSAIAFAPGGVATIHRAHYRTVCTMPAWTWGPRPHAVCQRIQVRP